MTEVAMRGGTAPGVARRLMAMIYDTLLSLGLIFVFTLIVVLLTGGQAVGPSQPWFPISLLSLLFLFFGWCWTHGGQTLGMRAWRLQLRRLDGQPLSWQDALKRYLASCLSLAPGGLGLWWAIFDRNHLALQDRLSGTAPFLLPKSQRIRENA